MCGSICVEVALSRRELKKKKKESTDFRAREVNLVHLQILVLLHVSGMATIP